MFNHIMIGSNDIERSKRFYDAVLGVLGSRTSPCATSATSGHTRLFYRHDGSTFCVSEPIDGQKADAANGGTIGFKCARPRRCRSSTTPPWRMAVTSIEEPPGPSRVRTLGAMHLAYVRDPDGNKLCAIHRPK